MEDFVGKMAQKLTGGSDPDVTAEAKKLREQLVEYDGYLQEMRKVTLKNVETLDIIQRYTDKSAAGMQKLAEQSLDGVQKVTAESAQGLRRIIETGTSNIAKSAQAGEMNVAKITEECLEKLQKFSEESIAHIDAATERNLETVAQMEKIEQAIQAHMENVEVLFKRSDEFTHKENVKVYRNVQAVVVDEVKKQTDAMAAQNEVLTAQNEALQKQNKSLRPLIIVTLVAALANIALAAAQIAGLF